VKGLKTMKFLSTSLKVEEAAAVLKRRWEPEK